MLGWLLGLWHGLLLPERELDGQSPLWLVQASSSCLFSPAVGILLGLGALGIILLLLGRVVI